MNYYISHPLYVICDLRCRYCAYTPTNYQTGDIGKIGVTPDEYVRFRNTHLKDAEHILVEFAGGETFLPRNLEVIRSFLNHTKTEKIDMLSNGIQPINQYVDFIQAYGHRIHRLGFSHHRTTMTPEQSDTFDGNAHVMKGIVGLHFYVKELYIPGQPIQTKRDDGVEVLVQDFKGHYDENFSQLEIPNYTQEEWLNIISKEYHRVFFQECSCRLGYKNIIITSKWRDGDIISCWQDQAVVGNIKDNTYNPAYKTMKQNGFMETVMENKTYNPDFVANEFSKRVNKPCQQHS